MESQKASSCPGWEKLEFTICSGDGKRAKRVRLQMSAREAAKKKDSAVSKETREGGQQRKGKSWLGTE